MALTPLERIEQRLEKYYEAEDSVLNGQSYTIANRTLTRANLKDIQDKIIELENTKGRLEQFGSKKRKSVRALLRDE